MIMSMVLSVSFTEGVRSAIYSLVYSWAHFLDRSILQQGIHRQYSNTIQGVSWLVDITAGGDFLGLCDQKSSYKCVWFWTVTELWAFFNSCTRPHVNRILRNQLAGDVLNLVAYHLWKLQRATRAVHNRPAARVAVGGGIFENQL